MKKQVGLIQENFDSLLNWFSANQEESGEKYEKIRNGLIRFFYFKGCADAENLADETLNRVAAKLPTLDLSGNTKPANVFYGFAAKIYLEYVSDSKNREVEFNSDLHVKIAAESGNKTDGCLEKCLTKLGDEEGDLILEYYGSDKSEKIECRKKIVEKMRTTPDALHVKVHRLRKILRKCIEDCRAGK